MFILEYPSRAGQMRWTEADNLLLIGAVLQVEQEMMTESKVGFQKQIDGAVENNCRALSPRFARENLGLPK
jgi:hypothetical protein